jgi:hypothetical protein
MVRRIARRSELVLNEFGFFTREQVSDWNRRDSSFDGGIPPDWMTSRRVFAVSHPDEAGRVREVFPRFQFEDHQPIEAVRLVLEALGEQKAGWKLALWFASNNGWLPGAARPVDLLKTAPDLVVDAARSDARAPAAL